MDRLGRLMAAYLMGLATLPTLGAVGLAASWALSVGCEIECLSCGYSTGPRRETRRAVAETRWAWHKQVTRRTIRCPYPDKRGGAR